MKNSIKYIFLFFSLWIVSCDKGFDDLNINKTAATSINPAFTLNNAIINMSFVNQQLILEVGIVQQFVTPNSGVLTGANFNQDNRDATQANWQRYYRSVIRHTTDVINQTADSPNRSNLKNMARIIQAFSFMVLTDSYGDVPYFEAGKGYIDQINLPKYDRQQDIYKDIINELTSAVAELNSSQAPETADILFGGDVSKWKKFGGSLLLRAGMRLVKVDPTAAQSAVTASLSNLMVSNADNAVVRHDPNYVNACGQWLNSTEANNGYLGRPFVDFLKSNNDPRLKAIATRYVGAKSGPEQVPSRANTDPAVQIGMPLGYDNNSIKSAVTADGLASFYDYSQIDRSRMGKNTAPMFLITYSQTSLLLAEAIERNWASGSASTAYENGIRAHMEQCASYDAGSAIAAADIDTYITNHAYDASRGIELINTQYWVSSFLNGPEAFANFRRVGFPTLAPNPFPGKGIKGDFIRRLTYPNSEISVNSVNVQEAISRQGADDLDTRVWWDK